jgi:AcrR family transcriptional regulator
MSTTGTAAGRPMRADARRNCEALVARAAEAFAERGADDVSLEEIARRAGVGIGTLYRHFPNRQSLLEAVFRDQVEALAHLADDLMHAADPGAAFVEWLGAIVAFGSTKRSMLAGLLATDGPGAELYSACKTMMQDSTGALLRRAQQAGAVRPDVTHADVQRLTHALVLASEHAPADPEQASRMLSLVTGGLMCRDAPAPVTRDQPG